MNLAGCSGHINRRCSKAFIIKKHKKIKPRTMLRILFASAIVLNSFAEAEWYVSKKAEDAPVKIEWLGEHKPPKPAVNKALSDWLTKMATE